jgi:hypothetical protein
MKAALHFFAPFLVLPVLWVYFSYVYVPSHPRVRPVSRPSQQDVKMAAPEGPGPMATVTSPSNALQMTQTVAPKTEDDRASGPDHVDARAIPQPVHFLHGQFDVLNRREFSFVVPPYMVDPKVQGSFRAFSKSGPGDDNQTPTEIDFALMNDEQYNMLLQGRLVDAAYERSSASQMIKFALSPTLRMQRRYHLIFLTDSAQAAVVDADFTLSFQ